MHWPALLVVAPLAVALIAATAYVVAGDMVNQLLDAADPVAAFAEELQDEVEEMLARAEWARDRPDFARWEQEVTP